MATSHIFGGKKIEIPDVYSQILSGFKNPPSDVDYGHVLIIDTGSGAGGGGGAGITGTLSSGTDAVYGFDNIDDFRNFTEKGFWYFLAKPLFEPLTENQIKQPGVSKITFIKAATTVPASMTFHPQGDLSDSMGFAGTIIIKIRNEGLVGNGALNTNSELSRGYGFKIKVGVVDATKIIMEFYRGTFRGLDQNGNPIGGIAEADTTAQLLCQSDEFDTLPELITWMNSSTDFGQYFYYDAANSSVLNTGTLETDDVIVTYTGYTLASGGTESYSAGNLTAALLAVKKLSCDFIFADGYGANSYSANNLAIVDAAQNDMKFKPQVYISSGSTKAEFTSKSIVDAKAYDSQQVTIVHGGSRISNRNSSIGYYQFDSYYTTALLLGREAGLQPQVPMTFKNISVNGLQHVLNETEMKQALNYGVLAVIPDNGVFEVLKGVNTLQQNQFLLNDDGTTSSKQLFRIAHQINKLILINAKLQLLKDPSGVNRNTLSELDVAQWTKRFLKGIQATPTSDNLIISFGDVTVTRESDAYNIQYSFSANTEISFLFFTGLIVDVN